MSVNKENLEKAVKAALEGPEVRDVRIADYRFNIKPAEISRNGTTISVVGGDDRYISRRRRGRPNDRIYYEFDKSGGEIKNIDVEIDRGGVKAIWSRHRDDIKKALEIAWRIYKEITEDREKAGDTIIMARKVGQTAASAELQHFLDGTWEGEASFLVGNIALRAE